MHISLIAAMADQRVIGKDNAMPWHLPADMAHFRKLTLGKPVLMGRKTFESLGKPLPSRTNIVLTRDAEFHAEGCLVVHSVEEALKVASNAFEFMVIGGQHVYELMLPRAQRMYLTLVHARVDGDAYFPPFAPGHWREEEREEHPADERNPYPYTFLTLERIATGVAE
ncbi:type 3 dihydrofolate reductase [Ectothiorhodospiraceae bacterium 2226]|nr:type 3 dihydrofolate reductase [Ectothiorhodospiraceae bacterium 2226]